MSVSLDVKSLRVHVFTLGCKIIIKCALRKMSALRPRCTLLQSGVEYSILVRPSLESRAHEILAVLKVRQHTTRVDLEKTHTDLSRVSI